MTREQIKLADTDFKDTMINEVDSYPSGNFAITTDEGSFVVYGKHGIVPEAGQIARFYPGGFGSQVHGLDINGREVYYKTPDEREAERLASLAEYDRKEKEAEAKSLAEYAERLKADPLAFDWDRQGPSDEAAAALDRVTDESEFPKTYSGQSWRYVWHLWQLIKADPDVLDGVGPYDDVPGENIKGWGLSGFMVGWGRNAVRQMRGKMPKPNGAILTIGDVEEDPLPSRRSAKGDLKAVIGA